MNQRQALAYCEKVFWAGLKPDPPLTVSQWADKYRQLPRESSSEPGQWRTSRTPYLKEIMDNLSPRSGVEKIVLMKAAQVGATEAGINWLGYVVTQAPGPMLIVQPTVDIAKSKFSKHRLNPTISQTPILQERIRDSKPAGARDTLLVKEFTGGIIILGGANSATGLRAMPAKYLFLDEVDAYPMDVDGEGDPVDLAIKRTDNFSRRKIFMASTPTVKGLSRIEKAFDESDQRRYHVPCPECRQFQWLKWANLKFSHKDYRLKGSAEYACEHCGVLIPEHKKTQMLKAGKWIPGAPGENKAAGYHLSALYSPIGWLSWNKIVQGFLDAKQKRDSLRLKSWVNTVLGETWEEEGDSIETSELYSHRSKYGPEIPMEAAVLTAGVDIQKDRLECEVVAWGLDEESWGMEYKVFIGNPATPAVWKVLDKYLNEQWKHESGILLPIACTCIDTGGHHTQQVYSFVRGRQARKIFAIKGSSKAAQPIIGRPSQAYNKKIRLFPVGTDTAKDQLHSRLQLTEPGPGYPHFPLRDERGYDDEYFKQLTAERVRFKKGKRVWEKRSAGARNEALDTRVYASAALELLKTFSGLKLEMAVKRMGKKIENLEQGDNSEQKKAQSTTPRRPRRANWVNNGVRQTR